MLLGAAVHFLQSRLLWKSDFASIHIYLSMYLRMHACLHNVLYDHALHGPPFPPKGQWSGYRVGPPLPLWCGVWGPLPPVGWLWGFGV